jgi:hypothetical protein
MRRAGACATNARGECARGGVTRRLDKHGAARASAVRQRARELLQAMRLRDAREGAVCRNGHGKAPELCRRRRADVRKRKRGGSGSGPGKWMRRVHSPARSCVQVRARERARRHHRRARRRRVRCLRNGLRAKRRALLGRLHQRASLQLVAVDTKAVQRGAAVQNRHMRAGVATASAATAATVLRWRRRRRRRRWRRQRNSRSGRRRRRRRK